MAADEIARTQTWPLLAGVEQFRLVRLGAVDQTSSIVAAKPASGAGATDMLLASEPGWLYLVDLAPDTWYEHRVEWLFVGETGDISVVPSNWWPLVDGETPDALLGSPEERAQYMVDADLRFEPPGGVAAQFSVPDLDLLESNSYIVVQGLLRAPVRPGRSHGEPGPDVLRGLQGRSVRDRLPGGG